MNMSSQGDENMCNQQVTFDINKSIQKHEMAHLTFKITKLSIIFHGHFVCSWTLLVQVSKHLLCNPKTLES